MTDDAHSTNGISTEGLWARVTTALFTPRDVAALAVFRILFGAMMAYSLVRYTAHGWIELALVKPTFFFKYDLFPWTVVWDRPALYAHFSVTAIAAVCVALGFLYRFAIVIFLLGFTYLQLLDVSLYLNHYYLVVLLASLMVFLPLNAGWSLDAKLWPSLARSKLPAWITYLLCFQVAVVYFFAALAKAQPDWLLYAQPLNLWMRARTETPIIGPLLSELWVARALSWAGFLYDLTIWMFLVYRPTRTLAYAVVLGFHGMTAVFFEIGMFPVIMTVATTLFFDPDWPRRLLRRVTYFRARIPETAETESEPCLHWNFQRGLVATIVAAYAVFQLGFPLRHYVYPGNVLWDEQGMRYAWKVMVREKNGAITYRVTLKDSGRTYEVNPLDYLTWRQFSDMSGQPDLIVQLGKHIAWDFERRGFGPVEVRVDAWVSLNGRRPALLLDPDADLTQIEIGWGTADWIRPMPDEPPPQLTKATKP